MKGRLKMQIRNVILCNYVDTLNKYGDMKFPQKISYAISKNLAILGREYEVYRAELQKIYRRYDDAFTKNEKGKPILAKNGLPEILDEEKKKAFNEEVMNFMTMTVDVDIFHVDEALFDYDDSKYETLTPKEIVKL